MFDQFKNIRFALEHGFNFHFQRRGYILSLINFPTLPTLWLLKEHKIPEQESHANDLDDFQKSLFRRFPKHQGLSSQIYTVLSFS